jgi:2'-deoxynucleoside 5'-phosphate N-hydrolase
MRASFEAIDGSDVMVIDLTEKGVGIGIEAGYAHARGLPITTIAEAGADISETLRGISERVIIYPHAGDLAPLLFAALTARRRRYT